MDLTLQQRAVLGAFLFYPNWSAYGKTGMRPVHIAATSPKTFISLFAGVSEQRKHTNPGLLPAHVARICRGLCDLGLMYKVGAIKARYINTRYAAKDAGLTEYESPLFAPTEAGMQYLMCVLDWNALPRFPGQHKTNRRFERSGLRSALEDVAKYRDAFERFICYDYQEAYKAKFKRARRCAH